MSADEAVITLGPHRVEGGWFVDRPWVAPAWLPIDAASSPQHLFTDDRARRPHVRDALVEMITGARDKVLFCSFLFSDEAIVDALCAAAERLHGGVYVLTALGKHLKTDLRDVDELPVALDEKRRIRHNEQLRRMARAGVWVRSVEDCHAKFCVTDDARALITSCNATQEAYEDNPENGLRLDSSSMALSLARLFSRIWLALADLEVAPATEVNVTDRPIRVDLGAWKAPPELDGFQLVATLRKEDQSLLAATLGLIDSATDELVIASYSLVSLKTHAVGAALRRALGRGVRLFLVLRPKNHHEDQRHTCGWLMDGVPPTHGQVRGHRRTHAKAIVADRARALLWTGNLDGQHGYDVGIEVGVVTTDPANVAAIRSHVLAIGAQSQTELIARPTQAELAALADDHLEGEWTLELRKGLRAPTDLSARLAANWIVLHASGGDGILQVDRDLGLVCRVDAAARALRVSAIQRGPAPRNRTAHALSGCTLRIVREPPVRS